MARITIEDCMEKIGNHFQLVLIAGHRARQLQEGSPPKIEITDEKPTITALREIAAGVVDKDTFNESVMTDTAAESELAELIDKGILSQEAMARVLSDMDEDENDLDNLETATSVTTPDPAKFFADHADSKRSQSNNNGTEKDKALTDEASDPSATETIHGNEN